MEERDESGTRRLPCLHGHIFRGRNHPRLSADCGRTGRLAATRELSCFAADCDSGRCAVVLEAVVAPVWTEADLLAVVDTELCEQCGLCEESGLRLNGGLSGFSSLFHLAGHGHW